MNLLEVFDVAGKDTNWKDKLDKAYVMMRAAYDKFKTAEDEFEKSLAEVDELVKEAIECGGADAEKQWQAQVAILKERIAELRNKVDRELKRIERQGQKLWERLVKNVGRPAAFVVAGVAVLAAGYVIGCIIHGIKCI